MDANNENKATVKKYSLLTNSWSFVGTAGFTATPVANLKFSADSNDNLYVAYRDTNHSLVVMTYGQTNNWTVISNTTNSTYSGIDEISLSISNDLENNNVYICFSEDVSDTYETLVEGTTETVTTIYTAKKLTVIYYTPPTNNTAGYWSLRGTPQFTEGIALQPVISVDNNDDVSVSYREGIEIDQIEGTKFRPTIQRYNKITSRWEIIEKRGVTQEQIPNDISSNLLQTDLIQDFDGNNYFVYSDFENNNKASMITSENRIVSNVNTSIMLDNSMNVYMFGYSDEKEKDNFNNIAVKFQQIPSETTDKTITFNLLDQLNFEFNNNNETTSLSGFDNSNNIYLVGTIKDTSTSNKDMTLLKIEQPNGVMSVASSYTIANSSRLNENATTIIVDEESVPNIYIGGYSNVDSPSDIDTSLPVIYKLSQDILNSTFTVAQTYISRDFDNDNNRISDMVYDSSNGIIYAAVNVDVSRDGITNWEWGLLKIQDVGGVLTTDISYIHQFQDTALRGTNNYVKSIKINNDATPTIYMSGYVNEYQYAVIQIRESNNEITVLSEMTKLDIQPPRYRESKIETLDLTLSNGSNLEYTGIDSDENYIYLSPYGNYSTNVTTNMISRIYKKSFIETRVENIVIPEQLPVGSGSNLQGEFSGITIDRENNYGYLSPFTTDISASSGYGVSPHRIIVRFSTADFTNNATESNFAACDVTNVIPSIPNYNHLTNPVTYGTFNGIQEKGDYIYLVPWDITACIRVPKSSFVSATTTVLTPSDIDSVDIQPLKHYSGVVVDTNYSYYSPLNGGSIVRISTSDFTSNGKDILNLSNINNAFINFQGITQDANYIYLVTNENPSKLLRISKSEFTNIQNVTDISSIDLPGFTNGSADIYYEDGFVYIDGSSNNILCRVDANNLTTSGISFYSYTETGRRTNGILVNNRVVYIVPFDQNDGTVSKINTKILPENINGGLIDFDTTISQEESNELYYVGNDYKSHTINSLIPKKSINLLFISVTKELGLRLRTTQKLSIGQSGETEIVRSLKFQHKDVYANLRSDYAVLDEVLNANFHSIFVGINVENRLTFYKDYINETTFYNFMTDGNSEYDFGIDLSYNFENYSILPTTTDSFITYDISLTEYDGSFNDTEIAKNALLMTDNKIDDSYVYKAVYNIYDTNFPEISTDVTKYIYGLHDLVSNLEIVIVSYHKETADCIIQFNLYSGVNPDRITVVGVTDNKPQFEPEYLYPLGKNGILVNGSNEISTDGTRGRLIRIPVVLRYNTRYTINIKQDLGVIVKTVMCENLCINRKNNFANTTTGSLKPQLVYKLNLAQRLNQGNLKLR